MSTTEIAAYDTPAPVVRVIAGPYWTLRPLPISSRRFVEETGLTELVPVPDDWSERACTGSRLDVEAIARLVREHAAPDVVPLLVLPTLARDVLKCRSVSPGRSAAVDLLRELTADSRSCCFDLRLVRIEGIDADDEVDPEFDLAEVRDRLASEGLQVVAADTLTLHPDHRAFWRAALNRLSSMGPKRSDRLEHLISALTSTQVDRGWSDPDGRHVLELLGPNAGAPNPSARNTVVLTDVLGVTESESAGRLRRMFGRGPLRRAGVPRQKIDLKLGKVTFVCEKMADRSGGAERVLIELANGLCRRGYQVDILSHEGRDLPPFYPLELGVVHTNLSPRQAAASVREQAARKGLATFQVWEPPAPVNRIVFDLRYRSFVRQLTRYIDAARPDVVVPFMPPAIVATAMAPTSHRPRLVASTHNAPEQDFENPERWDPGDFARSRRVELMHAMDAITVLLPEYVDWYDPAMRPRLTVMPNAVRPVPPDLLKRAERRPTILAIGRIAETKRHDLTLRAFAALTDEFPQWRLKIFGVGPKTAHMNRLRDELELQGRAELPGHTPAVADEYLTASILCHPARFEGFPLAVTEALASGLPVVGFADCSGVNSLVVHEDNGLLVDPGDGSDAARLAGLTDALRTLMIDEEQRTRLGRRGPESMRPYAPEHVFDLWEKVLFPESDSTR